MIGYVPLDNNAVIIQEDGQEPREVVAEWCDIETKILNEPK